MLCSASRETTKSYSYDAADRLLGTDIAYDRFGRITSLPSAFSGGGTLTSTYYDNDLIKTQAQDGVTNSYEYDSALRQRARVQTGGSNPGTEIYHYADESDSPAWIQQGSNWSRNIEGIEGELAAVQDSAKGTVLQLCNLHGDVVATASLSTEATKPLATFEFDEFGNPKQGSTPKYGWLGDKQRRTELPSGVIQMGVRSYVPAVGRFTSVDPIEGGSANTYDYVAADPINDTDLTGSIQKTIQCNFATHRPHKSSHKRGRVNAVTTGGCFGSNVTTVSATFRATMYRNGRPVATITTILSVPVAPAPIRRTSVKVPFPNAPRCKTGVYQVVTEITVRFPPGYAPPSSSGTIKSKGVFIRC